LIKDRTNKLLRVAFTVVIFILAMAPITYAAPSQGPSAQEILDQHLNGKYFDVDADDSITKINTSVDVFEHMRVCTGEDCEVDNTSLVGKGIDFMPGMGNLSYEDILEDKDGPRGNSDYEDFWDWFDGKYGKPEPTDPQPTDPQPTDPPKEDWRCEECNHGLGGYHLPTCSQATPEPTDPQPTEPQDPTKPPAWNSAGPRMERLGEVVKRHITGMQNDGYFLTVEMVLSLADRNANLTVCIFDRIIYIDQKDWKHWCERGQIEEPLTLARIEELKTDFADIMDVQLFNFFMPSMRPELIRLNQAIVNGPAEEPSEPTAPVTSEDITPNPDDNGGGGGCNSMFGLGGVALALFMVGVIRKA
jgi:hypothetical protein